MGDNPRGGHCWFLSTLDGLSSGEKTSRHMQACEREQGIRSWGLSLSFSGSQVLAAGAHLLSAVQAANVTETGAPIRGKLAAGMQY